jgi:excinuclease ABC subunit C
MIAEVVKRRYKYALRGEELWPDLVLIDGGLGHLRAAEAALKDMIVKNLCESAQKKKAKKQPGAQNTRIAAIAKREEKIYLQGSSKPLKLAANSPVRKLLQYVRDEAHRFAQHYHHILRSRKTLNKKS